MKNGQSSNIRMTPFGMRKDDDESWITINGTHVTVNGEGEITKGPGSLKALGDKTKRTASKASSKSTGHNNSLDSLKRKIGRLKDEYGNVTSGDGAKKLSIMRNEIARDPHMPADRKQSLLDEIDAESSNGQNTGAKANLQSIDNKVERWTQQYGSITEGYGKRQLDNLEREIMIDPNMPQNVKDEYKAAIDEHREKAANQKAQANRTSTTPASQKPTTEYGPGTGSGNIPSDATSVNLKHVGNVNIGGSAKDKVWGTVYEGKDEKGNTITFSEDGHLLWDEGGINDWKDALGEEAVAIDKATYKAYSSEE